jgi:hypothetical protein
VPVTEPVTILDPCGATGTATCEAVPPFGSLAGRRIGVLDNGKPNAALLMTEMAERLAARTGATVALVTAKRTAAEAAPVELIASVADQADLVLTGSADCGSCTSWSIYDVHQLEGAGVLAIGVTTTAFEGISREAARTLGRPEPRLAVVPHPLGGIGEDAVRQLAAGSIEQLLQLATR